MDDARVVAGWPMIRNRARSAISDAAPPLAGDAELYTRLIADRFTGPVYERVMDRLCRYGYTTIRAWVTSGLILSRCAEKRIKGLPAGETWSYWPIEDIEDLVQETVADAELRFRSDGLRGAGWHPDGGASLGGYFITGCLFAFASAYKRHRRDRGRQHAALAAAQQVPLYGHAPDVADTVTACADAAERLGQTIRNPRLRMVMQLHVDGWNYAEIGQVLADGTTPRAVEGMIYRCKRVNRGDFDGQR